MKICFFAPADSTHTIKWCSWFSAHGHKVQVISLTPGSIDGVQVHHLNNEITAGASDFQKLGYLRSVRAVRALVRRIQPDILSVHYATSYGTLAALAGVHPYTLSVWGSDIYEFPRRGLLHKALLKFSLRKADHLFSTSRAMAREAVLYTDKTFAITPFGVNTALFSPEKRTRAAGDGRFVIGTVKSLAPAYGIDRILQAAALVKRMHPEIPLTLRIAGNGPCAEEYRALAEHLGLADAVVWLGFISQEEAAQEWANMDLAVIPSRAESFGVSAVEAQASGTPLLISDVPGLMEAGCPGESCVVVPGGNPRALADAIAELYGDPKCREKMGAAGRRYVLNHYEVEQCFRHIESLFQAML